MQKRLKKLLCWLMAGMLCAEAGVSTVRAEAAAGDTFQEDALQYTVDDIDVDTGVGRVTCTGPQNGLDEIHVPASVTHDGAEYEVWRIGTNAFGVINQHNSLTTVTIAEGVTEIGDKAFQWCERLVSVSLPDSLTEIGALAFQNCLDLPGISLPEGITEIKTSTFTGCRSLTRVDIPDGVTDIGDAAFMNCIKLEDIELPESLRTIGDTAFAGCESLAEGMMIPRNVTGLPLGVFSGCKILPEVTLWDTTKLEGQQVFGDCYKLATLKIVVTSTPPVPVEVAEPGDCFENCPADRRLVFVDGSGAELTGDALAAAQDAYRAVSDGDTTDDLWYGWKTGETPARSYAVTIKVNKDNQPWPDSGKDFQLSKDGGSTYVTDLTKVEDGTYRIYEITGTGVAVPLDTGVDITVNGKDAEATVDYYTVGFCDGDLLYGSDTPQHSQVVLKGGHAVRPADPEKKSFIFKGWVTAKDGDVPFDFPTAGITATTSVYAAWEKETATIYRITASAGEGGSISPEGAVEVYRGGDQPFTITLQEGYEIKEVLVDGQSQGAIASYRFTNVTEDHTISVSFQKKEEPGDTEKPGEGEPGDTEKPGEGEPGDTEKPGEGDPGDTEKPGEGEPGDAEKPGDTENPGEGDPNNPDDPGAGEPPGGTDTPGDSQEKDEGTGTPGEEEQPDDDDGNTVTGTASGGSGHTGRPGNPGAAREPKTGDGAPVGVYATVAMVSGLLYTQLYFAGKKGMTKARKSELVSAIAGWAKKGGKCRRYAALAAIFFILVYYHSIGKCTEAEFGENMQAVE